MLTQIFSRLTQFLLIFGAIAGAGCFSAPTEPASPDRTSPLARAEREDNEESDDWDDDRPEAEDDEKDGDWLRSANCDLGLRRDRFALPSSWARTSPSVFIRSSILFIEPNGPVDDGFAAPCRLGKRWKLEVTGRLVSGGQNYVFPKIHGQFSNGYWFIATSLPDGIHGWLLTVCNPESWLAQDVVPGHTFPEVCSDPRWNPGGPASVQEGQYMTLRIVATGTHLQLFTRHANQPTFALAHEIPFSTRGLRVTRVGASQPWDAQVEITGMRAR